MNSEPSLDRLMATDVAALCALPSGPRGDVRQGDPMKMLAETPSDNSRVRRSRSPFFFEDHAVDF
jgi:hypothetical protein